MSSNVVPAGPKRRTLAEFGRQLEIGQLWRTADGWSPWWIDQIWRTDRMVHLVSAENESDRLTIRFAKLRDNWRRVV